MTSPDCINGIITTYSNGQRYVAIGKRFGIPIHLNQITTRGGRPFRTCWELVVPGWMLQVVKHIDPRDVRRLFKRLGPEGAEALVRLGGVPAARDFIARGEL